MDLNELSRNVLAAIDGYVYAYVPGLVGNPQDPEKIRAGLEEFRSALVKPYWTEIARRDTIDQVQSENPPVHKCAVVADDGKGTLLAFVPATAEFFLATRNASSLESIGVNGDAVGCFLAR